MHIKNYTDFYKNSFVNPFPSKENMEAMWEYYYELGLAMMRIIMFNMLCEGYDVIISTDGKGNPHITVVPKKDPHDSQKTVENGVVSAGNTTPFFDRRFSVDLAR